MTSRKPLVFEQLSTFKRRGPVDSSSSLDEEISRAQVPGGWLILIQADQPTLFFYPDPRHEWDGGSID
jgi:hypothetical protein